MTTLNIATLASQLHALRSIHPFRITGTAEGICVELFSDSHIAESAGFGAGDKFPVAYQIALNELDNKIRPFPCPLTSPETAVSPE